MAHTSVLKRAQCTLCTILREMEQSSISVYSSWRLNERHYGGLTGLDKSETAAKYGEEKVFIQYHELIYFYRVESEFYRLLSWTFNK